MNRQDLDMPAFALAFSSQVINEALIELRLLHDSENTCTEFFKMRQSEENYILRCWIHTTKICTVLNSLLEQEKKTTRAVLNNAIKSIGGLRYDLVQLPDRLDALVSYYTDRVWKTLKSNSETRPQRQACKQLSQLCDSRLIQRLVSLEEVSVKYRKFIINNLLA